MPPKTTKTSGGSDIRSFFGGATSQPKTPAATNGLSQKRPIVLDLTDDEDPVASSSKKPVPPHSSASNPMMFKPSPSASAMKSSPSNQKAQPTPTQTADLAQGSASRAVSANKRKSMVVVSSDEEDEEASKPPPKKAPRLSKASAPGSSKKGKSKRQDDDNDDYESMDVDDEDGGKAKKVQATSKAPSKPKATAKRRGKRQEDFEDNSDAPDDDDFLDDEEEKPKKKAKAAVKPKAPAKGRTSASKGGKAAGSGKAAENVQQNEEEEESKPKPKFNWAAKAAARLAGPVAPGSKEVPEGKPNCLAGLTFVFTGELTSLSRQEAIDLANRYGGRVTGQPSSKTSFVVVGGDAGPSKLASIKKNNLSTLDEDGFLDLIRTREPILDAKTLQKMKAEEEQIAKAAKEIEKREKLAEKENKEKVGTTGAVPANASQLWTVRYAPQSLNEICGNKGQVEKLQKWLHDWPTNLKSGFNKPGKDGMGTYRAVLITGPPGIGKTTSAHLAAKLEGLTSIELNASDARSKKLVQDSTNIHNKSLDGWIHGVGSTTVAGAELTDRTVLIMDEIDGMSGGDRGGVGALNGLIKKTQIPIICIANERNIPKMKPLQGTTFNLPFRKPDAKTVRSRIMTIAFKEKMKIPPTVVDQLVMGVQSDIRQVINMLSTWKLSSSTMDFDEGKQLAALNEKYSVMTPWGVIDKLFGPYAFSATSRETLNDKMEYYFHDFSFVPLFVQENYAKVTPAKVRQMDGPSAQLKHLELLENATRSISDGDLVDSMIHAPEQHWSLMPLHAITSTVYPASQIYGQVGHYGSGNAVSFPGWLGHNSKRGALQRQLNDVQIRMRLKVSGDKAEIRQTYIPMLFPRLIRPLIDEGSSAVDSVITMMDEYYLSKDEWDTIVELGVDEFREDSITKKISTATKTAFTRKYNAGDHPIAFNKGQDVAAVFAKKAEAPDLEEAFDVDEEPDDAEEDEKVGRRKTKDPTGIADDKLLKVAKGKGKAVAKPRAKK